MSKLNGGEYMIQVIERPQIAKYNVLEYHKMLEAGIFPEGVKTELIDGEVYIMPPMGGEHYGILARLTTELSVKLFGQAVPISQVPMELSDTTEPEPDFIVLEYREDYYRKRKGTPQEALLFIEVSKSTLDHDRYVKLPKYAETGIKEVWIINATKEIYSLEIYREPVGNEYTIIHKYTEGKLASPLEFPDTQIRWW
jgi:Uma2 family endonuclease